MVEISTWSLHFTCSRCNNVNNSPPALPVLPTSTPRTDGVNTYTHTHTHIYIYIGKWSYDQIKSPLPGYENRGHFKRRTNTIKEIANGGN
jgi:hypothetical protein